MQQPKEASQKFGREKITIAIDTAKNPDLPCGFEVMVRGGTAGTGIDAVDWAQKVEKFGAGGNHAEAVFAGATRYRHGLLYRRLIVHCGATAATVIAPVPVRITEAVPERPLFVFFGESPAGNRPIGRRVTVRNAL